MNCYSTFNKIKGLSVRLVVWKKIVNKSSNSLTVFFPPAMYDKPHIQRTGLLTYVYSNRDAMLKCKPLQKVYIEHYIQMNGFSRWL